MFIGPSGSGDLTIQNPHLRFQGGTIGTMQLVTGQTSVADQVHSVLQSKLKVPIFPVDIPDAPKPKYEHRPRHPLFDGVTDHVLRALIAVGLGCDAWPGGIFNFGPKSAEDELERLAARRLSDSEQNDAFAAALAKDPSSVVKDKEAMLCFAQSLVFEKCFLGYIHDPPLRLYKYVEEFGCPQTVIDNNGPEMLECCGIIGTSHRFLSTEGQYKCIICNALLCRHCRFDVKKGSTAPVMCMECVRGFVDVDDLKTPPGLTEGAMRDALAAANVELQAKATYSQVLKAYNMYVEDTAMNFFSESISQVKFPLLPSSALHPSSPLITRIKQVNMAEFGDFIRSEEIGLSQIADLIHLLASFVHIELAQMKGRTTHHKVLSKNLIDCEFAQNARVHSGERLCKRAIRHATDPVCPDIIKAEVAMCTYEGKVCLLIWDKVKASMKKNIYETTVAFSHDSFIAASCNCKSGSKINHGMQSQYLSVEEIEAKQILCTHGLTTGVKFSFVLHQGLAEHVLIELRVWLQSAEDMEKILSAEDFSRFKSNLMLLLAASGRSVRVDEDSSVLDLLQGVAVGTDLSKRSPGHPREGISTPRVKSIENSETRSIARDWGRS